MLLEAPHSEEAHRALETVLKVLLPTLEIPIAVHKTEGPDTLLVFLGIEVDRIAPAGGEAYPAPRAIAIMKHKEELLQEGAGITARPRIYCG